MSEKTFKILSLDGGGIKGLYTAKILEEFEKVSGYKIHECFNMICGTSTGGLIALALSIGIPAQTISQFYIKNGSIIFPYKNFINFNYFQRVKQLVCSSKYNNKKLEELLINFFNKKKIKDSFTELCIPSFNVNIGRANVFKKDHHNLNRDNEIEMYKVGLATSSAPTFFPIYEMDNGYHVDGGVWANNPSMVGYLEAKKYFINEIDRYKKISILSIESLNNPKSWNFKTKKRLSVFGWNSKLFELPLIAQSNFTDFFLNSISENENLDYYRIKSTPHLSSEQEKRIFLDYANKKTLKILKILGEDWGTIVSKDSKYNNFFKKKE